MGNNNIRTAAIMGACIGLIVSLSVLNVQAATVTADMTDTSVGPGETFTLNLIGVDFSPENLDGGGINVSFDPSVVNVTNVSIDDMVWEFFSAAGTTDNSAGTITGIVFNSFQPRTGDLTFASVDFVAVGPGTSPLGLGEYGINPFASGGLPYPDLVFDDSVTIQVIPVPAAVWLFGSALGLLGWVRRRRIS